MKTSTKFYLIVISALVLWGCDEDNILNKTSPVLQDPDTFFSTEQGALAAINATYVTLASGGMYNEEYYAVSGAGSDDWFLNNTWGTTLNNWSFTPTEAGGDRIDQVWQALYQGVFRSNIVIQNIPDSEINQELRDRILGEAYFMRGYFYWHLAVVFGEVPVITEADPNDPTKAEVAKSSVSEVYNLIFSDLQQAIELLPPASEYGSADVGRASKGAAETLLGKAYLYMEDYTNAETHFDNVIASGEYQLMENFNDVFITENSRESIFEIQYDGSSGGIGKSEFGYANGHGGSSGNYIPTQDAVEAFEDYSGPSSINGKDPRLFYSIWRQGDPYDPNLPGDEIYQESWAPSPGYSIKKAYYPLEEGYRTDPDSRNRITIRYADLLLMNAEAALMNNKPEKALDFINQVRDRVGMPLLSMPLSNDQLFDAIVHERRVELMFEHHRINDLRRWGLAEEELGPLGYQSPKHRYFPLPAEEVESNPNLEQNPNY